MIDERHEELAALYALDLLDGAEREAFEREFAHRADLRALVDELRESSAALAYTAPEIAPPAALKSRILASVQHRESAKIIRIPAFRFQVIVPWAAAAGFALAAAWFAQLYLTSRAEAVALSEQFAVTDLALRDARQHLEAERIVGRGQLANLAQTVTDTKRQLDDATARVASTGQVLAEAQRQLAAERDQSRTQLADLDRQLAAATSRADATLRQLTETRQVLAQRETELNDRAQRLAALESRTQHDSDLANFKIATLASMLKNSPQALAVAVWNPARQEGLLTLEKMPAPAPDRDLELWVIDGQQPKPISAGLVTVSADGSARVRFTAESPVGPIAKFAISREKKGGAPAHGGPQGDVIMASP
jgi:anti-sigma-K factor RskA